MTSSSLGHCKGSLTYFERLPQGLLHMDRGSTWLGTRLWSPRLLPMGFRDWIMQLAMCMTSRRPSTIYVSALASINLQNSLQRLGHVPCSSAAASRDFIAFLSRTWPEFDQQSRPSPIQNLRSTCHDPCLQSESFSSPGSIDLWQASKKGP